MPRQVTKEWEYATEGLILQLQPLLYQFVQRTSPNDLYAAFILHVLRLDAKGELALDTVAYGDALSVSDLDACKAARTALDNRIETLERLKSEADKRRSF